jgi:hypothetical protein
MLRAYGATGFRLASQSLRSFPRQPPPTFLRLLERSAFPYRNRKNVIYRRNVMRNTALRFFEKYIKIIDNKTIKQYTQKN